MSWYTDWFLAGEDEAEAIASIATDEGHSFDDWPHLALRSVGETELAALWGALGDDSELASEPLFVGDEQEGPLVRRVDPRLIAGLAALKKPGLDRVATAWHACEQVAEWEPGTVAEVLREMADFARRAKRARKPVLQLDVW
jgi:hypothetical protein